MSEDHRLSHAEIIERYLKPGDTITHIRCMGCIQEHVYTGKDGGWLCGYPTRDTMRLDDMDGTAKSNAADDIAAANVTHINRYPVSAVPFLAAMWPRKR